MSEYNQGLTEGDIFVAENGSDVDIKIHLRAMRNQEVALAAEVRRLREALEQARDALGAYHRDNQEREGGSMDLFWKSEHALAAIRAALQPPAANE